MGNPASKIGIPYRLRENQSRHCQAKKCSRPRMGFNRYCPLHMGRKYTLGSAESAVLYRTAYGDSWAIVKKFVHDQRAHGRIIEGISALEKWMLDAQQGKPVPAQKAVALLADKGAVARPEMVFVEILAVALHASIFINPATTAPWLLGNAMLHGIKGAPRGPQAISRARLGAAPLSCYYSARDRQAMNREVHRLLDDTIREMILFFARAESIRNEEIAARAKAPREAHPFISACTVCSTNARKAAEKRAARKADPQKARENDRRWSLTTRHGKKKPGATAPMEVPKDDSTVRFARRCD